MRITICAAFYPPYRGGYAESVRLLAKGLAACGHAVAVIACGARGAVPEETVGGVSIRWIRSWNPRFLHSSFPLPNPLAFWNALRAAEREGVDVVSTQTRFFPSTFIGFVFAKFHGIPVVHTERGASHTYSDSLLIRLCAKIVDHTAGWLVCRFSNGVIGVSGSTTAFTRHLGARSPITVHNGIDSSWWQYPINYMRDDSVFRIAFVGRLVHAKGVDELFVATSALLPEFPDMRLSIVGDGPYRTRLEAQAKSLGITNVVQFHGALDSESIRDILWHSRVFVNPSHSEGFPRSVLEAAAVGLPIIATDVGGTREIIEDGVSGILIKERNPMALMGALRRCMCDKPLSSRMGKAAGVNASYFSVARMTDSYEKNFTSHAIL